MNTTATRRLLLPLVLRAVAPPRWHNSSNVRTLWAGARALAEDEDKRSSDEKETRKKSKGSKENQQPPSSIFEEIFPEEDLSALFHRRNTNRQQKDQESGGSSSPKIRIITSTHVDKSEATEWRAAQEAAKAGRLAEYLKRKQEAISKIPELLVPKSKSWGPGGSDIPELGSKPWEDGGSSSSGAATKQAQSLFDELFQSEDPPKATKAVVEDRHVYHGDLQAWIDSLPRDDGPRPLAAAAADKERPVMLILSNASNNLSESDFYRVGPQGQHLDGWGASIKKGNASSTPSPVTFDFH